MDYDYEKEGYYFRIDEKSNTIDSLEKAGYFLSQLHKDEFYWKWAMIALHNALYGSMILALMGTHSDRVKDQKRSKKIKIDGQDHEEKRVIGFWEAFKRVQNPRYMKMYIGSRFVCITPEYQKKSDDLEAIKKAKFFNPSINSSIEHLNDYIRNQFLHYFPVSISYGKGGFVGILEDATDLIEFLLLESGNIMFLEGHQDVIKNNLLVIRREALRIKDELL